jgi:hypothetical protein
VKQYINNEVREETGLACKRRDGMVVRDYQRCFEEIRVDHNIRDK